MDDSEYYQDKCVDAGNNVLEGRLRNYKWKYVMKRPNIDPEKIVDLGSNCFLVPSETQSDVIYLVDTETRDCTCADGASRGPCKHKMLVSLTQDLPSFDVVPTSSPEMRQVFMFLGTGKSVPLDWFLPLQALGDNSNYVAYPLIARNVVSDATDIIEENNDETGVASNMIAEEEAREDMTVSGDGTAADVTAKDVRAKLGRVIALLQEKIDPRIESDPVGYSKALDVLEKSIKRLPDAVDSALQKSLIQFGKSVTHSYAALKRKKSGLIPVQATARSRRVYKMRGSRSAVAGRPRNAQRLEVQMNVDDDLEEDGVLRHKLPCKKRKSGKGHVHDLMSAVSAVVRGI